MSDDPTYIGALTVGDDGSVSGWIEDAFGFRIVITGTRQPHGTSGAVGGYLLRGDVVVPAVYEVAAIDRGE